MEGYPSWNLHYGGKLPHGVSSMEVTYTMEVTSWNLLHHGSYLMELTPWKLPTWNLHHGSYLMELTPWKLPHGTYTMEVT